MPWILVFVVFCAIMYNTRLGYVDRQFWRRWRNAFLYANEMGAVFPNILPIDNNVFINIDTTHMPFGVCKSAEAKDIEARINENLKNPIICVEQYTNIDIKKRFGTENLRLIAKCEENYNALIKNLNEWALLLISEDNINEAEDVLNIAVSIGSNISGTYALLYDIYTAYGNKSKLAVLYKQIENLPNVTKDIVLRHIDNKEEK